MIGVIIVVISLVCLGVGFVLGRRNGIEAEMRRQLREQLRDQR